VHGPALDQTVQGPGNSNSANEIQIARFLSGAETRVSPLHHAVQDSALYRMVQGFADPLTADSKFHLHVQGMRFTRWVYSFQ
jgi:hypothetical protein